MIGIGTNVLLSGCSAAVTFDKRMQRLDGASLL
jgi:predicted nucleic-acid-binding protein